MLAASLKYQIRIEIKTASRSAQGTPSDTWDILGERRAAIVDVFGSKTYDTEQELNISANFTTFQFRYISGLNYNCRIKLNDDFYYIDDIQLLRRKEGYRVKTERRQNG